MDFQKMSNDINEMCTELKLLNPDGLTEFKFNKIQKKILENINEHNINLPYTENDINYIKHVEEVIEKQVMDNSRINREYLLI